MGGRKAKSRVLQLLERENIAGILQQFATMDDKEVLHGLFAGICRSDERVRWNAIKSMGPVVARVADKDMEEARIVLRRMLWSLNDESGGIGWGAPEAMAEIMVHHQGLAEEYIHMLISYMREDGEELFQDGNYLEHELLQRGLLWGIARLAETRPEMLLERQASADVIPYLLSGDAVVRGLAAKSLGLLKASVAVDQLESMLKDREEVRFFEDGAMRTATVAKLAGEALARIRTEETC